VNTVINVWVGSSVRHCILMSRNAVEQSNGVGRSVVHKCVHCDFVYHNGSAIHTFKIKIYFSTLIALQIPHCTPETVFP
jgi:hypothetical protein